MIIAYISELNSNCNRVSMQTCTKLLYFVFKSEYNGIISFVRIRFIFQMQHLSRGQGKQASPSARFIVYLTLIRHFFAARLQLTGNIRERNCDESV